MSLPGPESCLPDTDRGMDDGVEWCLPDRLTGVDSKTARPSPPRSTGHLESGGGVSDGYDAPTPGVRGRV